MEKLTKAIQKRECPNDVFLTPLSLVDIHLNLLKPYYRENDLILDPFFGSGHYYNKYPDYFPDCERDYTELSMGRDFFAYDKKVGMICSNPPYSCIDKVLQHSVSLEPHTISYLIGQMNLTAKRIEYMESHGYKLVHLHLSKVFKWFGMSYIVVFSKLGNACVSYDRIVHK
jgi:hypothetical protein